MTELDRSHGAHLQVGTVARRGDHLVVEAPAEMSDRHWRRVGLRLDVDPSGASKARGRAVAVPLDAADRTRHELIEAWPASQWLWQWEPAAQDAANSAARLRDELREALAVDVDEAASAALLETGERIGLRRRLLPEQARAAAKLVATRSGANFSVPGSGKTTMTYAVFAHLRAQGVVDRMLVVAPLSAHQAWVGEAHECFTDEARPVVTVQPRRWPRGSDVVVVNYERAAGSTTPAAVHRWAQGHRLLVVFDEAHRAKRGKAGLHGAAAAELASLATCRLALTGTPMPNGEQDLAVILDLVWPGAGERLVYGDLKPRADRTWVRVTKDQLHLEPMRLSTETVRLDPAHRQVYDLVTAEVRKLEESGLLEERPDLAYRAVMRMLAVASNPSLILSSPSALGWDGDARGVVETVRTEQELQDLVRAARPAKLLRVSEIAQDHARRGEKLLVWTNFLGNVVELERVLGEHRPAVITGGTPVEDESAPTDRVRELRRFREDPDCQVLIATPQTLGEGISLHRTSQSQVHLDRSFNAGLYLQALDRTHRVGMPPGTHASALALIAEGTIDERVQQVLTEKIEAMRHVLDDPSLRTFALPDPDAEADSAAPADDEASEEWQPPGGVF
ncbi:DEAD/DEAH box helicase [Actinomycetospora flava]|uniref:DEAD/DEAH box helicase n=1 Tax=Actinomycetospora flava TaxID=3129232 RepID=A0ABU8MHQ9_9PSEU